MNTVIDIMFIFILVVILVLVVAIGPMTNYNVTVDGEKYFCSNKPYVRNGVLVIGVCNHKVYYIPDFNHMEYTLVLFKGS